MKVAVLVETRAVLARGALAVAVARVTSATAAFHRAKQMSFRISLSYVYTNGGPAANLARTDFSIRIETYV